MKQSLLNGINYGKIKEIKLVIFEICNLLHKRTSADTEEPYTLHIQIWTNQHDSIMQAISALDKTGPDYKRKLARLNTLMLFVQNKKDKLSKDFELLRSLPERADKYNEHVDFAVLINDKKILKPFNLRKLSKAYKLLRRGILGTCLSSEPVNKKILEAAKILDELFSLADEALNNCFRSHSQDTTSTASDEDNG